jgi:predicted phage terminase large subunit-like protein
MPTTNVVNLATALHRDALAMELARTAGWKSRTFAAIIAWPKYMELWNEWEAIYRDVENADARQAARAFYERHSEEMNAGAKPLWPAVEDLYTLMRMRVEIGQTAFDREKQGMPFNPELCEWPEKYFGEHIWFDAWPSDFVVRAIALDPSKGRDANRGDYSAYVLVGIDRRGLVYVEADLARRATTQMVADGAALCKRVRPGAFGVEANQFQELLCEEIAREFRRQGLGYIRLWSIHNSANKMVRIRKLGQWLSQQRLRFLRASQSTQMLVEQLRDFPIGAHDDGPDALELAFGLGVDTGDGHHALVGFGNRWRVG